MKRKKFTLQTAFICLLLMLFSASKVSAHGVQVGYCQMSNGFIRVYIEHWHGNISASTLRGNGMNITTTYGSTTVTQNLDATGFYNDVAWNNLAECGSSITILQKCAGLANTYNDWVYYDFAPAVCGQQIKITLNQGNTVLLQEACGNLYPQTITTTFTDNSAPVIVCKEVNVNSCVPVAVDFSAQVSDACDPNPSVSYSIASGSTFNVGTTEVTVTATDNTNQTSTCKFNVIVTSNDTEDPVITCPSDITVDNDASKCGASVSITDATASDNCALESITGVRSDALALTDEYPVGTTTITWTATDESDNTATCTQTITVKDAENPTITCNDVTADPTSLSGVVVNYTEPSGSDNCPGATTALTSGPASGSNFPIGTTAVTYTVTDAAGNTVSCTFNVTVTDPYCSNNNNSQKVYVCHNGHTICISVNALNTHLNHGDALGECKLGKRSFHSEESFDHVDVYPNPTNTNTTVYINSAEEGNLNVKVMSITGETLFSFDNNNFKGFAELPIDLTTYAPGMYFIHVAYGNKVELFKVQRSN